MKRIKLVAMDVDGTLTDGKIYMGSNGELMKTFDIKDGLAIHEILPSYGVTSAIITGRESKIVINRAEELEIPYVFQGVKDKAEKLREVASLLEISLEEIAFLGDDLGDMPAMNISGVSACPANAASKVRKIVDYVACKNSGDGAVREIIEWFEKQGLLGGRL